MNDRRFRVVPGGGAVAPVVDLPDGLRPAPDGGEGFDDGARLLWSSRAFVPQAALGPRPR